MVPDFRRDDVWMPDQVRHDGKKRIYKQTLMNKDTASVLIADEVIRPQ
jgi:hypothetical protein